MKVEVFVAIEVSIMPEKCLIESGIKDLNACCYWHLNNARLSKPGLRKCQLAAFNATNLTPGCRGGTSCWLRSKKAREPGRSEPLETA